MCILKLNNENNNKKRKILLSTLIPCSIAVVALSCGLGFGLGCKSDGWTTIKTQSEADKYLKKHVTRHDEPIYWNSEIDSDAINWFSNTKHFGYQNLMNGFVNVFFLSSEYDFSVLKVKTSTSSARMELVNAGQNLKYTLIFKFEESGNISVNTNFKGNFKDGLLTRGETGYGDEFTPGERYKGCNGELKYYMDQSGQHVDIPTWSEDYPNVTWYCPSY